MLRHLVYDNLRLKLCVRPSIFCTYYTNKRLDTFLEVDYFSNRTHRWKPFIEKYHTAIVQAVKQMVKSSRRLRRAFWPKVWSKQLHNMRRLLNCCFWLLLICRATKITDSTKPNNIEWQYWIIILAEETDMLWLLHVNGKVWDMGCRQCLDEPLIIVQNLNWCYYFIPVTTKRETKQGSKLFLLEVVVTTRPGASSLSSIKDPLKI